MADRYHSPTLSKLVLSCLLALTGILLVPNTASAQNIDWRWRYPDNVVTLDWTSTFTDQILGASADYTNATPLQFEAGPTNDHLGNYANLITFEGNYGEDNWWGVALPFDNNVPCSSLDGVTGKCSAQENYTADFAYVLLNSSHSDSFDNLGGGILRDKVVRHEWGHVFGLRHVGGPTCDIPSVMNETKFFQRGTCSYLYDTLQGYETGVLHGWY